MKQKNQWPGTQAAELTQTEQQKVQSVWECEDSLKDLWDDNKQNTRVREVPEEREQAGNLLNVGKETDIQIQEAQAIPQDTHPKSNYNENVKKGRDARILTAAKEKQLMYQRTPLRLLADISAGTLRSEGSGMMYSKCWKKKKFQPKRGIKIIQSQ